MSPVYGGRGFRRLFSMRISVVSAVIDEFSRLSLEDKEYVAEIIEKQLIEAKREAIGKRAREAMANLKKGVVKEGTVKDLYEDLESENNMG